MSWRLIKYIILLALCIEKVNLIHQGSCVNTFKNSFKLLCVSLSLLTSYQASAMDFIPDLSASNLAKEIIVKAKDYIFANARPAGLWVAGTVGQSFANAAIHRGMDRLFGHPAAPAQPAANQNEQNVAINNIGQALQEIQQALQAQANAAPNVQMPHVAGAAGLAPIDNAQGAPLMEQQTEILEAANHTANTVEVIALQNAELKTMVHDIQREMRVMHAPLANNRNDAANFIPVRTTPSAAPVIAAAPTEKEIAEQVSTILEMNGRDENRFNKIERILLQTRIAPVLGQVLARDRSQMNIETDSYMNYIGRLDIVAFEFMKSGHVSQANQLATLCGCWLETQKRNAACVSRSNFPKINFDTLGVDSSRQLRAREKISHLLDKATRMRDEQKDVNLTRYAQLSYETGILASKLMESGYSCQADHLADLGCEFIENKTVQASQAQAFHASKATHGGSSSASSPTTTRLALQQSDDRQFERQRRLSLSTESL